MTADEWRERLAALPTKEIHRLLKNESAVTAQISSGFRPGTETLKNPLVLRRLADALPQNPKLADALEGLEAKQAPLLAIPPSRPPSPASMASDPKIREKLKAQRTALKEKDTLLAAQAAQLVQLEKEKQAALTERDSERQGREALEVKLERERRRKAPDPLVPPPIPPAQDTQQREEQARPGLTLDQAWIPGALTRLLQRGHDATVLALSRELLTDPTLPIAARAGIQGVYASALDSLGAPDAPEQCRLAADAFLSAGQVLDAAEALLNALTHETPRAAERAQLQRLLALAERKGERERLGQYLVRQRLIRPVAFACLNKALESIGKKSAPLLSAFPATRLSPDEAVALPTNSKRAASVTARQLVAAVEESDTVLVQQARLGISELRVGNPSLADTLLDAVGTLSTAALVTLTAARLRPVVVDASNVARHIADPLAALVVKKRSASAAQLVQLHAFLLHHGFFPIFCIADANLRHLVTDKALYASLIERHIVRETLPGTSADAQLLTEARAQHAPLLTNDRLSDWGTHAEGIERLGFTILTSGVCLLPS